VTKAQQKPVKFHRGRTNTHVIEAIGRRYALCCAAMTGAFRDVLGRITCGVFVSAFGIVVSAHHSFAMFDTTNPITLAGVVTTVQWTNPHVYIEVDVSEGPGMKHWTMELGSPSILMRGGWKFNSVKKGDKITAVVSPLRSGDPGSLLVRITLPDGRVLGNGGPAGVGSGVPPPSATSQR
jgi:hypothetical protein